MKKIAILAKTLLVCMAITIASCGGNQSNNAAAVANNDSTAVSSTINIRYIDSDSVTANYNLAKDFREASLRTMSKLESAQRSKRAELEKFAAQIQQKGQTNGYLSQESYNADMEKLAKMQQDAEAYLATLERNAQQEMMQQQLQ